MRLSQITHYKLFVWRNVGKGVLKHVRGAGAWKRSMIGNGDLGNPLVSRGKLAWVIRKFIVYPIYRRNHYKFPQMSSYQRMLVHRVAAYFGMDHNVDQTGNAVVVNRTKSTRLPDTKFRDYIREELLFPEEPRRSILKRDSSSFEDSCNFKVMHIDSRSWEQWWPIHLFISLCDIGVLLFLLSQYCCIVIFLTIIYLHVNVFWGDWHFPEINCSFIGPTEKQAFRYDVNFICWWVWRCKVPHLSVI